MLLYSYLSLSLNILHLPQINSGNKPVLSEDALINIKGKSIHGNSIAMPASTRFFRLYDVLHFLSIQKPYNKITVKGNTIKTKFKTIFLSHAIAFIMTDKTQRKPGGTVENNFHPLISSNGNDQRMGSDA